MNEYPMSYTWQWYERDPAQMVECSECHQPVQRRDAHHLALVSLVGGVVVREEILFACTPACRDALAARYQETTAANKRPPRSTRKWPRHDA